MTTELAPESCIVCHKANPKDPSAGWAYLANSTPTGAMACSPQCLDVAVKRFQRTGRTDLPEREKDPNGRVSACRCLTWPCPCACHRKGRVCTS